MKFCDAFSEWLLIYSAGSLYSENATFKFEENPPRHTQDRVRKPKKRYLKNNLQSIVMCRGGSNKENTSMAANSVHSL